MKDLNLRVFQLTGNSNVFEMKIGDIAQLIIENILADKDGYISDEFMELMANHLHKFYNKSKRVWVLFAEICMQRISLGAMSAYNIPYDQKTESFSVPSNLFSFYPSSKDKVYNFTKMVKVPSPLNDACLSFLVRQSKYILVSHLRKHMTDILFNLVNDLTNEREHQNVIVTADRFFLLTIAKDYLYLCLPPNDILNLIAEKDIWYKHIPFIQRKWPFIDHRDFAIKIGMRGPFKKFRLYRKVFYHQD